MKRTVRVLSGTVVVAASMSLVACAVDSLPTSIAPSSRSLASANSNGYDLPIYGLGGLRRATPQSPCADGSYRQFDFWVGNWKVYSLTGALVATSRILNTLDGCVIEENWAPLNGLRGRSLSSYDAESGLWRQTWVPENSQNGRPIRLAGGLRSDGVMDMSGQRRHWFFGYTIFDHFQWTPVDADHVIQAVTLDIPQLNIHSAGAPHYERTTDLLPPTTSPGTTKCLAGGDAAESRNFDFTVGNWKLTAANGLAIGTSSIAIDPTLSGCLTIESFSTPKGYRAISWLYYDALENTYFRTYVDTEGERVEMRGTFDNGVFTMEGAEPIHGADGARVRMTWKQTSATTTLQTWEVSRDGETWREVQAITFTRQ
jgi:hypothetical protein